MPWTKKIERIRPPLLYWSSVFQNLRPLIALAVCCAVSAHADDFQGATHLMPFEEDTIGYSRTLSSGPVAKLQSRINKGEVVLKRDAAYGYLLSVLENLHAARSSQMLVFSKTSFQRERIDPKHPRALFLGDDVYVGYVPGSPLLEISEADPKLGAVFYTLDQTATEKPRFVRNDQCLECHASSKTMGVPGHLVRSFATDESGVVDLSTGISLVNHRTPLAERWGGWYVSGTHGAQTHRGNLMGKEEFARQEREPNFHGNVTKLEPFFDPAPYPAASSDIVALMVLEHQLHLHNFLTRLYYESTIALRQYGHVRYVKSAMEGFVKYLLFAEEAPLTARIEGVSSFAREFPAAGPRDSQGRSLREFDLQTRMFKYPCSYLIYSDAFAALPKELKTTIYQRLLEILTGQDKSDDFKKLSTVDRRALLEILADTKLDLPKEWKKAASAAKPKP